MTYLATVLADNPLHFWRLADGAGEICHDIGSARKPLFTSPQALGYSGPNSDGGAAYLDGTDGIVSGNNISLITPLSVEFLFWPAGVFAGAQVLCAWDNNSAPSVAIVVTALDVTAAISGSGATSFVLPSDQEWFHIVMTYDEANIRLYVNAVDQSDVPFATHENTAHLIGWGEQPIGGGNKLNGLLSELAIYDHALTPARVTAHFLAIDQLVNIPVNQQPGAFSLTSTSATFVSAVADLNGILEAVRKTFPTT